MFRKVFESSWQFMPELIKKRYSNVSSTNEIVEIVGKIDINTYSLMKLLAPLLRFFIPFPLCNAEQVPITVHFFSKNNNDACFVDRTFYLKANKPFHFCSKLEVTGDHNVVIEYISSFIGCILKYSFINGKVVIEHQGYVMKILGATIPVPITWLVGRIYAEEKVISDESFAMNKNISHFQLGKLYEYKGIFSLKK